MDRLGSTWMEAAKGRDILVRLRSECEAQDKGPSPSIDEQDMGSPNGPEDLNDWLASHDLWSLMTTDPALRWDQAGVPFSLDPMNGA